MRIKWALSIDRLVGAPLGLALRAAAGLFPRARRAPGPIEPPRHILVLKCLGFGSIIQMAPMLATLRAQWPEARITLLTFEQNAGLAALMPCINDVATIEFRQGRLRFAWETLRAILHLRRARPDLLIDCEFFSYYVAFLTHLIAPAKAVTIGYFNNRRTKDWIFTHAIAIDLSEHITQSFQKALAPIGIDTPPPMLEECGFAIPQGAHESLAGKLTAWGIGDLGSAVVVNINASDLCLNRRWPVERYQELLRRLAQTDAAPRDYLLIGGHEDVEYVTACCNALAGVVGVHNLAGKTTLPELAALLSGAALFIGNDSGPLHLAEACGVPSISFFGPETPNLYGPRGEKHTVFYDRPHCSPCLNVFYAKDNNCNDNICLKAISVEQVIQKTRSVVRRSG